MSLLRTEDYLYDHGKHVPNVYWSQIIKTIDQFDQLLQIEKKEISSFLKQKIFKKIQMIKRFNEFKDSQKALGQSVKKQIIIIDKQKSQVFFKGYFKQIRQIIYFLLHDPKKFANYIKEYKYYKKHNFLDFCQNIHIIFYPFYLPQSTVKMTNCLQFMQQIIMLWPYNLEQARPKFHSVIDDIIYGFLKIPPIICYLQKITGKFLKQISKCKMQMFAFDQEAIKNELQIKKHATISYNQPESKSILSKFKSIFKKSIKDDSNTIQNSVIDQSAFTDSEKSQSQFSNIPEVMKKRQTSFVDLIKNTVQSILNEQPPFMLKKLFQFFHKKLQIQYSKRQSEYKIDLKHYCYFLMTNFICAQLHNKFSISHQQTGMTNADLQNISQIIRILSSIFQGQDPELKRYKTISHTLNQYKQEVMAFYNNILYSDIQQDIQHQEVRQTLINYYQKNFLISFNDIKIFVDIYHQVKQKQNKQVDRRLNFLSIPQVSSIFDSSKKIKFNNSLYNSQNVIFIEDWTQKSIKQIVDEFISSQQPLQYLPLLKDIFFFSSNLTVEESLQVIQDLKLIKKMPLKDIKLYLAKTANKFRHLNIKDFQQVEKAFKESLKNCLKKSLQRKQYLIYYRSQILYKLEEQITLINYYINELRSQSFYENISQSFLRNIKIKAYINIQNNLLKVNKDMKDLKGLAISNLMLSGNENLSSKSNEDYILRNSFKCFDSVKQLMRCIGKNPITKSALITGRKVQDFNQMFKKTVNIVISNVQDFVKKKVILQNLTKQKLQILIMKKLQNMITLRYLTPDRILQDDKQLQKMSHLIDKQKFYQQDIAHLKIETQFLLQEAKNKLKVMVEQINVNDKIAHLYQLFKVIMTIVGFTKSAMKVSTDTITPILQYILLDCAQYGHFKCLYAIQCLKYNTKPDVQYLIASYKSSLTYIKENMALDFPKQ